MLVDSEPLLGIKIITFPLSFDNSFDDSDVVVQTHLLLVAATNMPITC